MFGQAAVKRAYARRSTRIFGGLASVLLVIPPVLTGCASKMAADTSRPPVLAPGATPATTAGAAGSKLDHAKALALSAYSGYIAAETNASQTADYGSSALSKYASDPLLGQWITQLFHLHVIGDVQRGSVISHPVLQSLTLSATSGTAIVRDCLDQSGISLVNARTGATVPLPKTKPFVTLATLYLFSTGVWMVSKVDSSGAKSC